MKEKVAQANARLAEYSQSYSGILAMQSIFSKEAVAYDQAAVQQDYHIAIEKADHWDALNAIYDKLQQSPPDITFNQLTNDTTKFEAELLCRINGQVYKVKVQVPEQFIVAGHIQPNQNGNISITLSDLVPDNDQNLQDKPLGNPIQISKKGDILAVEISADKDHRTTITQDIKLTARKHQVEAVKCLAGSGDHASGRLITADTGTGKSGILALQAHALGSAVMAVPAELTEQMLKDFTEFTSEPCVIAPKDAKLEEIRKLLEENKYVVLSHQQLALVSKDVKAKNIMIDEAHQVPIEALEHLSNQPRENIIVAVTATPTLKLLDLFPPVHDISLYQAQHHLKTVRKVTTSDQFVKNDSGLAMGLLVEMFSKDYLQDGDNGYKKPQNLAELEAMAVDGVKVRGMTFVDDPRIANELDLALAQIREENYPKIVELQEQVAARRQKALEAACNREGFKPPAAATVDLKTEIAANAQKNIISSLNVDLLEKLGVANKKELSKHARAGKLEDFVAKNKDKIKQAIISKKQQALKEVKKEINKLSRKTERIRGPEAKRLKRNYKKLIEYYTELKNNIEKLDTNQDFKLATTTNIKPIGYQVKIEAHKSTDKRKANSNQLNIQFMEKGMATKVISVGDKKHSPPFGTGYSCQDVLQATSCITTPPPEGFDLTSRICQELGRPIRDSDRRALAAVVTTDIVHEMGGVSITAKGVFSPQKSDEFKSGLEQDRDRQGIKSKALKLQSLLQRQSDLVGGHIHPPLTGRQKEAGSKQKTPSK